MYIQQITYEIDWKVCEVTSRADAERLYQL